MKKFDTLMTLNRAELYDLAIKHRIRGRSAMSKKELARELAVVRGSTKELKPVNASAKNIPQKNKTPAAGKKSPRQDLIEGIAKKFEATPKAPPVLPAPAVQPVPARPKNPTEVDRHGLPESYGVDKIVLLVKDPYWLFTYWDFTRKSRDRLIHQLGSDKFQKGGFLLRVYDVTDIDFNGKNAHHDWDIPLGDAARSWYIKVSTPDRDYCVDFVFRIPDSQDHILMRSNIIHTPRASVSKIADEEYMTFLDKYDDIFTLSGGYEFGSASESVVQGGLFKELDAAFFSAGMSSASLSSSGNLQQTQSQTPVALWLNVKTELVLYGATDPDATLTVKGQKVSLREDGSFTLRFGLPDGEVDLPVTAQTNNGKDRITLTPVIKKKTT